MNQDIGSQTFSQPLVGTFSVSYEEHKRNIQIMERRGLKFIVLKHHKDSNIWERVYPVEAKRPKEIFDSATNTRRFIIEDDPNCGLIFIPDDVTGERFGFLLDTDANRQMLATHLMDDRWDIMDREVLDDVRERASKIAVVVDRSKAQANALGQPIYTPEELARSLTPQHKEELIRQKKAELKMLEDLDNPKAAAEEKPSAAQETKEQSGSQRLPAELMLEDKCREAVHTKHKGLVKELIKKYTVKVYKKSPEYLEKIQPEVDKAIAEAKKQ